MKRIDSLSHWKSRHAIVVWLGIVLNMGFVLPLIFAPEWFLSLFGLTAEPLIWPRFSGILLGILSVFYIPATLDIDRYRIFAWLSVFPSRTFGAVFFSYMVFVAQQPAAFLMGVALDGSIGIASLWCLIRIVSLEQQIAEGDT
ncbi:hypothetical protein JJJ17_03785 [Paracoccus caeni]|uniref:Transmembrane protein n=1 Tax=Paracoccus caeni TaxID=657651 RepID=A0A934VZ89_9RHOB|nr:hypothetical protein [Paracoccus caeni]MBK4215043.1 hypothetical protein [Paracoccus caeni]